MQVSPYLERPLRTLAEVAAARSSEEREPPEQLAGVQRHEPGAMSREEKVHHSVRVGAPGTRQFERAYPAKEVFGRPCQVINEPV